MLPLKRSLYQREMYYLRHKGSLGKVVSVNEMSALACSSGVARPAPDPSCFDLWTQIYQIESLYNTKNHGKARHEVT